MRKDSGYRAHNSFLTTLSPDLLKRLRRVVRLAHFRHTSQQISNYEIDRIIEVMGPTALERMREKLRRSQELVDRKVIRPELAAHAGEIAGRVDPEE